MALVKAVASTRVPRHWGIVGFPDAGKSTFLAAMSDSILLVDADQRGQELFGSVANLFFLSEDRSDHRDPLRISEKIRDEARSIRESGIKLISVDSMTAIIEPLTIQAVEGNLRGLNKNKAAAYINKANAVKLVQDAVTSMGTDAAFIWHLQKGGDANGQKVVKQSLPDTERARLMRSLNATIELRKEQGKRVAKVVWSRTGGVTVRGTEIVDEEGYWRGVPEKLDALFSGKPQQPPHASLETHQRAEGLRA